MNTKRINSKSSMISKIPSRLFEMFSINMSNKNFDIEIIRYNHVVKIKEKVIF